MSSTTFSSGSSDEDYSSVSNFSSSYSEEDFTSVSTSHSKKLKSSSNRVDRLSALPDSILQHVLSFVDMKDVMETSLLSKRWRLVWMDVPCLNVGCFYWHSRKACTNFVNKLLLFRGTSSIEKFQFNLQHYYCSAAEVKDLLILAERKHVREVELQYDYRFEFPSYIFTSTVKVLKLSCRHSRLPDSLCFAPHLKILEIGSVRLPADDNRELVLTCPILESLIIRYCSHKHLNNLNISAPLLRNLVVRNTDYCDHEFCLLHISTPNLRSLVLEGTLYYDYSLTHLSSLVNTKFKTSDDMRIEVLIHIVKGLHNATNVELVGELLDTSNMSPKMLDELNDYFVNLRCLKLIGWSRGRIPYLLQSSPSIDTLVLGINQVTIKAKLWGRLFPCIDCLTSIEIHDFKGRDNELQFVEFVLQNAVSLKSVTVKCVGHIKELETLNDKIHSLIYASSRVTLLFQMLYS